MILPDSHSLCHNEGWIYIPEELHFEEEEEEDAYTLDFLFHVSLPLTPFDMDRAERSVGLVSYHPATVALHERQNAWWYANNPDMPAELRPNVLRKRLKEALSRGE